MDFQAANEDKDCKIESDESVWTSTINNVNMTSNVSLGIKFWILMFRCLKSVNVLVQIKWMCDLRSECFSSPQYKASDSH